MASRYLYNPLYIAFSANTLAGEGNVIRNTYTVPAGKRATVQFILLQVNANGAAANTVSNDVLINAGAGFTAMARLMDRSGAAQHFTKDIACSIDMIEGEQIRQQTTNTSAVNVGMAGLVFIKEYQ